ncbi:MAG: ABC transporter permease [Oscillospiraceae bacterium]|jgi:peptide/nickel transport system permease protein|nr:ABC transporter permease [Oscillospiraceae bacterium]
MIKYIIKRLLWMIPTLLGVSLMVLLFIEITPGDPARMILGNYASDEQVAELRAELGLDDPLPVRYYRFVVNAVKGDLGKSLTMHTDVTQDIFVRFPYTLIIVCVSLLIAVLLGIPIGIYAATHQYTWKDNAAIFGSLFCVSMPSFWFALILINIFAIRLSLVPPMGIKPWTGWILPCVSLAIGYTASIARQMRSSMLDVIRQDYITTARAKGQTENKVLYKHALKNALIPVIMILGGMFGMSLGGALIAETIFSIPGLGSYTLTALTQRDYPVIQGSVLYLAIAFGIVMLVVDVLFAFVDPRIRSQYSSKKVKKGGNISNGSIRGQ